jgi:hypothetical protein
MNRLKKYNESLDPDIKSYLGDILLELEDKGLYTYIEDSVHNRVTILISNISMHEISGRVVSSFTSEGKSTFELGEDVLSCLYHLTDYLKEEGYKISYINLSCNKSNGVNNMGQTISDSADDLDDLRRIVGLFNYGKFKSITLKYTYSYKR